MALFLHGVAAFVWYVIPVAGTVFLARVFLKIPDELFRKILHFILLGAYIPILYAFPTWWMAVIFALLIIVLFYPVFMLAARIPNFSSFVNERKRGEFKSSLVLVLSMMAVCISICWGILDDKLLVLASIYGWGVGDGFAALIGKKYGKHKLHIPFADPHKSVEGSAAMFLCSFLSVLTILLIRGGLSLGSCLLIAFAAASVITWVELCTKGGNDTITCPTAAMAVILPLIELLGG